jgi:predicted phage tail protein
MLRKIKLYGKLAKFIGHRVLEADVATAAEAVRFLLANWPELEAHMSDQHYRVSIGTYDIDLEELHHPAGAAPISFVPVVSWCWCSGADFDWRSVDRGIHFYPWINRHLCHNIRKNIFRRRTLWCQPCPRRRCPAPNANAKGAARRRQARRSHANRTHSAAVQNTSRAGTPVPIVYGETLVGSVVISAGIDTVQVAA